MASLVKSGGVRSTLRGCMANFLLLFRTISAHKTIKNQNKTFKLKALALGVTVLVENAANSKLQNTENTRNAYLTVVWWPHCQLPLLS